MWRPFREATGEALWIWVHPAFYDEFVAALEKYLELKKMEEPVKVDETGDHPPPAKIRKKIRQKKDVNHAKLAMKNVPFERTPKFSSPKTGVTVTMLKGTLNMFRLTGPQTQYVLRRTLQPTTVEREKGEEEDGPDKWWEEYYSKDGRRDAMDGQYNTWKDGLSKACPGQVPPGTVFGLVVRDPRVLLPEKRDGIREEDSTGGSVNLFNLYFRT